MELYYWIGGSILAIIALVAIIPICYKDVFDCDEEPIYFWKERYYSDKK